MRRASWLFCVVLMGCALIVSVMALPQASARGPLYGVGVRLGSLSGVTAQYRVSDASALNAALSYDLLDPSIDLSFDHVFINKTPILLGVLYPYFGWGGRLRLYDRPRIGLERDSSDLYVIAQAPIGVEAKCSRRAWCVRWRGFIELVPGLLVFPRVDLAISGALGVRYHF